jgi:glycerate 2-kinase
VTSLYPVTGCFVSAGTDGIDGPTDAAGAMADSSTLARAAALGLDARRFLDDNDSYHSFEPLEALLKTGPTGTNIADVRVLLIPR